MLPWILLSQQKPRRSIAGQRNHPKVNHINTFGSESSKTISCMVLANTVKDDCKKKSAFEQLNVQLYFETLNERGPSYIIKTQSTCVFGTCFQIIELKYKWPFHWHIITQSLNMALLVPFFV